MIAVGILIALAASVASASAIVLQAGEAHATATEHAARLSLLRLLMRRRRWVLGTGLLALAWPLQIISLAFAPLTVVQPVLATYQLILIGITRFQQKCRIGPQEWLGALGVSFGVTLVITAAPQRTVAQPSSWRVAVPLAIVGGVALAAFVGERRRPRHGHMVTLGAGFGYAWVDFSDKLVSNSFSAGELLAGSVWLLAVAGFGAVALLEENTALQRRSPVQVAPVIGAIQEPLPVIMALAAGVETWVGGVLHLAELAAGLLLAGIGATVLAQSAAAARTSV